MHGETNNFASSTVSVAIASIDDTDMDNENENNISGSNLMGNTIAVANVQYNPEFEINNTSIDLDMYISGFTGLMRINRLVFLAEHCPLIRIDALRLALNYVMETFNTQLYSSIFKQYTDAFSKLLVY
jgi:hypothetical protein